MGEVGRNKAVKSICFPIFGIFRRLGGTLSGFSAGGQELFWKTTPQKRAVFFNQSQVLGLCLEASEAGEEPEVPEEPKAPDGPKAPEVKDVKGEASIPKGRSGQGQPTGRGHGRRPSRVVASAWTAALVGAGPPLTTSLKPKKMAPFNTPMALPLRGTPSTVVFYMPRVAPSAKFGNWVTLRPPLASCCALASSVARKSALAACAVATSGAWATSTRNTLVVSEP